MWKNVCIMRFLLYHIIGNVFVDRITYMQEEDGGYENADVGYNYVQTGNAENVGNAESYF